MSKSKLLLFVLSNKSPSKASNPLIKDNFNLGNSKNCQRDMIGNTTYMDKYKHIQKLEKKHVKHKFGPVSSVGEGWARYLEDGISNFCKLFIIPSLM